MSKPFKVELIYPVEQKVEHHNEAGQRGLAKRLLLPQYACKSSLSTPPLGLLRLATVTPKEVEGRKIALFIRDDVVKRINPEDWDNENRPDLVGISCTTAASERAAYLTAEALRRKIQVVIGGPHTSVDTEGSLKTGAAVVKGSGENWWPKLVGIAANGGLENRMYENRDSAYLRGVTLPPRSYFNPEDYFSINVLSAGEGCPFNCPFCSTRLVKGVYKERETETVLEEIDHFRREEGMVIITDDNFFMHPNADRIMERLGKRGHQWYITTSSRLAQSKPELIQLAGKNGCRSLFMGIDKMEGLPKNKGADYPMLISKIREAGIIPSIGFVLGLGSPTGGELQREADEIEKFVTRHRIAMIHLSSSVPYPGTREYQLKKDRLIRKTSEYDTQGRVVYEPQHLTAAEFDEIYFELCKALYSIPNILWRLSSVPGRREKMELFFYNLARWRHIKKNFATVEEAAQVRS